MKQPYVRTYANGGPTSGWERGELVTTLADVKPGDVLIHVSHQFQAENLIRVVPTPEGFSGHAKDVGRLFHYEFVDACTLRRSEGDVKACWDWELFWAHRYVGGRSRSDCYRATDRRPKVPRKTRTRAGRLPL